MIRMFAALGARKTHRRLLVAQARAVLGVAGHGAASAFAVQHAAFSSLYKELAGANVTLFSGSCALAADIMARSGARAECQTG